ncbi:AI-2E family transporter [Telluribacter sp. SYSU D00476]|uniref:AI-2E family transporter n=1 Tax=Telluribacter sp. SYSU D00476 TaxID=2811430 RepID=UPI0021D42DF4|nr:AI-2E family transporter [Telluribacter sp. SYSU D00476]
MVVVTLGVYWMIYLRGLLVPIIVASLLSVLVSPITIQLEEKGVPRIGAISLTIVLFLGLIAGILYFVTLQISEMIAIWPELLRKGREWLWELQLMGYRTFGFQPTSQMNKLQEMSAAVLSDSGSAMLLSTTATLADTLLVPLYMFFMLYYRNFFCSFLYKLLGREEKRRINRILLRIYDVVHNYLAGLFIVMVIVGSLNTISLLVLDIEYAVFFGFFAALLLLIPYIGVIIGSLLPITMALITKDSPMYAVGVAGAFMVIQFIEGNFITPCIVGSKISINPLMAIIALVLGSIVWGIPGMVLALPLIAILKVVFDHSERLKPFGYILGEPSGAEMAAWTADDDDAPAPKKQVRNKIATQVIDEVA